MDTLKIIGQRLKELRKEKRLRQAEMAKMLGITPQHYQRIEYGKVNVQALTLCTLADYFNVSVDYLLGRSEERQLRA